MKEFGIGDIEVVKRMPATTYFMLLEEMNSHYKKEKEAMKKR